MFEDTSSYLTADLNRFNCAVRELGDGYFKSKTVLELGAGYGHNGELFSGKGAIVTSVDGRSEHIAVCKKKRPQINAICRNLEKNFSDLGEFDITVHFGLLYHIDNVEEHMKSVAAVTKKVLLLETIVRDNLLEKVNAKEKEQGYDQAVSGIGSRMSEPYIESLLTSNGFKFRKIVDARINWNNGNFNFINQNNNRTTDGKGCALRRFYVCEKNSNSK